MSRSGPDPAFILGVDAGGTKSEALLADTAGRVIGYGLCTFTDPSSGRGPGGSGRTGDSVRTAVSRALKDFRGSLTGDLLIIGRGRLPEGAVPSGMFRTVRHRAVSEQDAALALAGSSVGVVALAGTGAFVFGRTEDGRELLLDAFGPLLGDAGSAFDIGLRALRKTARASWHPRHATSLDGPLQRACASHVGGHARFDLVSYMLAYRDRSEIASLARIVDEHAEAGDAVACSVLREAADEISETLYDVVERLEIRNAELPLVAAGSVARKSRLYWERLCSRAREFAPLLRPVVPEVPDVVGMVLAGADAAETDARFAENLRAGVRAAMGAVAGAMERGHHAISLS